MIYVDGLLASAADIPSMRIIAQAPPALIGSRQSTAANEYDIQWNAALTMWLLRLARVQQILSHFSRKVRRLYSSADKQHPGNVVSHSTLRLTVQALYATNVSSDGFNPTGAVAGQTAPNLTFTTTASQNAITINSSYQPIWGGYKCRRATSLSQRSALLLHDLPFLTNYLVARNPIAC